MSCNCTSQIILPTVADDYAASTGTSQTCSTCEDGVASDASLGSDVPSNFLDTQCANSGITLLARIGNKLSRFTGSGFLKLEKGKASVVCNIPLMLTTLWHEYGKISFTRGPVPGNPLPFKYLPVGDAKGNVHAIKGVSDEDCSLTWKSADGAFEIKPTSENEKTHKGLLPRRTTLELVGYAPIPDGGNPDQVRPLSSLQGSGIIVVDSIATVDSDCNCPGCDPSPAFASVARFLPNPTTGTIWSLKFNRTTGSHFWSADA